ncbi:uncharacterized protein GGS22DRAFT_197840 [Annulohypoxylon maeteangense]|uniref:uncharacterized protein n=1 Tax=Annulohypoxylon maeteangense TaxID=1927788 RepID=UPI00200785D9|nr:uncharacterized protein GGS22DRAFT_197840 [Annulohypoxylon maeteangense]KAI0887917.1 hypothetical protein GGS22DRAFT_197840 [Annulohypoxylon maeteangense]
MVPNIAPFGLNCNYKNHTSDTCRKIVTHSKIQFNSQLSSKLKGFADMFVVILVLAALTIATTIPAEPQLDAYTWHIVDWQAGKSHGDPTAPVTGWYTFNVTGLLFGEGSARIPPFTAHCEGNAEGDPITSNITSCILDATTSPPNASVLSQVLPVIDYQAYVAIIYSFYPEESQKKRNFTVNIAEDWAEDRPPHNFTLAPFEIS